MTRHLGDRLDAGGREVVVFLESMIGEREEFAEVMSSFRATGSATRAALLAATRRFADSYRAGPPAVVIQDMLLPYLPSLLAWGFSDTEIVELFGDVAAACSGIELIQVHLDGSPKLSLQRAVDREDSSWLSWMIAKVSRYADAPTPLTDLPSLVDYFEGARQRTHRLLAEAPWPVVVIDADHGQEHALNDARRAVTEALRTLAR